jgi:hypothetical protein
MSRQGATNNTFSGYEFDSRLDNLDALEALLQIKKKTPPNRILSTQPPIAGETVVESTQFVSSSHIPAISLGCQAEKHCSRTNLGATPSHVSTKPNYYNCSINFHSTVSLRSFLF